MSNSLREVKPTTWLQITGDWGKCVYYYVKQLWSENEVASFNNGWSCGKVRWCWECKRRQAGPGVGEEGELWGRAHYYMVWELARLGALQPHSAPLPDLYNVYSWSHCNSYSLRGLSMIILRDDELWAQSMNAVVLLDVWMMRSLRSVVIHWSVTAQCNSMFYLVDYVLYCLDKPQQPAHILVRLCHWALGVYLMTLFKEWPALDSNKAKFIHTHPTLTH